MENQPLKLIHVACIEKPKQGHRYLFLRKLDPNRFVWFEQQRDESEIETAVHGVSIEESIRLARKEWKRHLYRPLNCGFRYTLPERDEHGINALFHQMVASYSSMNGVYFDEDMGCNCFINFASLEARELWQKLKFQNKL